jgi:hypothetical protein
MQAPCTHAGGAAGPALGAPAPHRPVRALHQSPLFWLALLTLVVWLAGAIEMGIGTRRIALLRELPVPAPERLPPVSVVIAARNEARNLEPALGSVLAQRYPGLEVIVVNDRSTDATGAILERLAAADPRLRVLHVRDLPPGWLGKNHALQHGAEGARGEWILFTDADVEIEPLGLARAMGYALEHGVEHVAIAPELRMPGVLLDAFAGTFALFFARFSKPWKARDPRSRRHIGVGAFNLVRADAYRAVGGHEPIRLRPDDDLKLGKVLKQAGVRQDLLFGQGAVVVEWYSSVGEMVRGLEKNAFAGVGYSVAVVAGSSLALLVLNVWPFLALLLTTGPTRLLNAAAVAVILGLYAGSTRGSGSNPLAGLLFPVTTLIFVYTVVRATVITLRNGGIRWRDTFYPLDELRANRV